MTKREVVEPLIEKVLKQIADEDMSTAELLRAQKRVEVLEAQITE